MKKFLSFMVMSLFAVLPFSVNAASEITYNCGDFDAEGVRTCTVGYLIDASTPQDSVTVQLTEHGGAEIISVDGVSNSEFSISTQNAVDNVWSIVLVSPDAVSGEYSLLSFKYRQSGTAECKVTVGIGNDNKDVETNDTPTDTPTDNVQTGSTLPYIALGAIALIAVGAYVTTKNKSKMYKI